MYRGSLSPPARVLDRVTRRPVEGQAGQGGARAGLPAGCQGRRPARPGERPGRVTAYEATAPLLSDFPTSRVTCPTLEMLAVLTGSPDRGFHPRHPYCVRRGRARWACTTPAGATSTRAAPTRRSRSAPRRSRSDRATVAAVTAKAASKCFVISADLRLVDTPPAANNFDPTSRMAPWRLLDTNSACPRPRTRPSSGPSSRRPPGQAVAVLR